jgi:phage shock protein E
MSFIKKNLFIIIGTILGAIGGYLYYLFVGCESGTCAISSKPVNSTVYWALMGGLLFSIIKRENIKSSK